MGYLYLVKEVFEDGVKNVSKFVKNHGSYIAGTGGIVIVVAIFHNGIKKAESKGYKKGFIAASTIYEEKFRLQTEAFLAKVKSYKNNKREYDALIKEYEEEIIKLENKVQKTEKEVCELKLLLDKKTKLLALKVEDEEVHKVS